MLITINTRYEGLIAWFDDNERVVALELCCLSSDRPHFRVWSRKEKTCILVPFNCCSIINPEMSKRWIIEKKEQSDYFIFRPKAWTMPGFWEDYYDDNENAIKIFYEEASLILIESGQNPKEILSNFST